MARIRTIKPEFPQSESMGRISREARLCFVLLWTVCDDAGRTRGSSRMLASLLYPYDDDAPSLIDAWIGELEREHCVVRYSSEGDTYIEVCNWLKHQRIDNASRPKFPGPIEGSLILARVPDPLDKKTLGPRTKEGTKDQGPRSEDQTADFESWYAEYPRKVGRGHAFRAFKTALTKTSLQVLIAAVRRQRGGWDPKFTKHPATWLNGECWLDQAAGGNGNLPPAERRVVLVRAYIEADCQGWIANWGPEPTAAEVAAQRSAQP